MLYYAIAYRSIPLHTAQPYYIEASDTGSYIIGIPLHNKYPHNIYKERSYMEAYVNGIPFISTSKTCILLFLHLFPNIT